MQEQARTLNISYLLPKAVGNTYTLYSMSGPEFILPIWYDLVATFAFAITGAIIGLQKKYDIVIVFDIKTRPAESVRNIVRGKKQP